MRLTLCRQPSTDEGTPGVLLAVNGRLVCHTMELPWRDNDPAGDGDSIVSCIPSGLYVVDYLPVSASGKYRDVYQVQRVPNRTGILIHAGNFAGDTSRGYRSDLLGCIAPCRSIGRLAANGRQQLAGIGSKLAMNDLHAVTGRTRFELEVIAP